MSKQNENDTRTTLRFTVTKTFEGQLEEFLKDTQIFPEKIYKKDALSVALDEFDAWQTDPEAAQARESWFTLEPPDQNQSETVQFTMGFGEQGREIIDRYCEAYNVSRPTMAYSIVVWWFKSKKGPRQTLEDSKSVQRTRVLRSDYHLIKMLLALGVGGFKTQQDVCMRAFDEWLIWRGDYDAEEIGPVEYRALPVSTDTEVILVQMPHRMLSLFKYWGHMDQMKVGVLMFNAVTRLCAQLKHEHKEAWRLVESQSSKD